MGLDVVILKFKKLMGKRKIKLFHRFPNVFSHYLSYHTENFTAHNFV